MSTRESFDVPLAQVGNDTGRAAGRARAAALVLAATLVGAVSIGLVDGSATQAPDGDGRRSVAPSPARAAGPTRTSRPAALAPERHERLPALSDVPLAGAPAVIFQQRTGDDLRQLAWSPDGGDLEPLAVTPGAYAGIAEGDPALAVPAPSGELVVVRGIRASGGDDGDVVRLMTVTGRELWARHDAAGVPVAPIWAPDASRVLVAGSRGTWRILRPAADGTVAELAVDTAAAGTASEGYLVPVAFSGDGAWIYAARADVRRPGYRPAARISTADGRLELADHFPVDGPGAPVPDGRLGLDADPATGRRFMGPGLALSTGPTDVRVFEADGREAFVVRLDVVVGLAWAGDGRLLALETDTFPEPSRVRLLPIGPDGTPGEPLGETGALSWASLAGVRDGHALLAFSAGPPDDRVLAVVLRLADGDTATLSLDPELAAELQFGGWGPPGSP